MNAADDARIESPTREELLQRFPGLSDEELPFGAHEPIKEHLMREVARGDLVAVPRRVRRPLLLAIGVAAAACAVAVALTMNGAGPGETVKAAPAEPAAVRLLDRLALAAASSPGPSVRNGQFMYTKTVGHSTALSEVPGGGMEASPTDESAERWLSVDGSAGVTTRTATGSGTRPPDGGLPSLNNPTYRFLETLPTDPDRLLELIYEDTRSQHGPGSGSTTGPDQQAFVAIGDLLRGFEAPPGLSAALYRAAARIPGVVLVPESKDAAGRPGVAVAREHNHERTEWIFDKQTLRLLGAREVALRDSAWGKAGTVMTSVAIVDRGVTDLPGQLPTP
ncbi:CU044_5270 family protein [Streptomyces sp. Isolate_45]|uniref:CU044_5270 family protein n=1 Tax=Streptomyces sp. Isolate_45 TaxID=2950111 RepID=UPI002481FDF6|nr:CU044_5270 family protein [Streptomyces sp. Isolate_45]MDA5279997.1 CU044_5270 family protein [Streptomyces sp. Isolate_45]